VIHSDPAYIGEETYQLSCPTSLALDVTAGTDGVTAVDFGCRARRQRLPI
jgi:hypothetical protein